MNVNMTLKKQIAVTKEIIEQRDEELSGTLKLILENQLVIMENLKELIDEKYRRSESCFGPG